MTETEYVSIPKKEYQHLLQAEIISGAYIVSVLVVGFFLGFLVRGL